MSAVDLRKSFLAVPSLKRWEIYQPPLKREPPTPFKKGTPNPLWKGCWIPQTNLAKNNVWTTLFFVANWYCITNYRKPANSERMIWTGRIRGRRMTAGHAWEQIKFTALDAGEFYQTVSVTEEAFLLFSLSVWFLLFLLSRKKKQEKWDKKIRTQMNPQKQYGFLKLHLSPFHLQWKGD